MTLKHDPPFDSFRLEISISGNVEQPSAELVSGETALVLSLYQGVEAIFTLVYDLVVALSMVLMTSPGRQYLISIAFDCLRW